MATPTFFLPHEALANEPTLLDRIQKQTLQRAQISRTTREEDVAQRTQAAYRMLEGIEEEAPTGGYGALFGQRASGAGFRTKEDAAAFLRATDPEGMTTRQQAVGEFMANQALPRLGTITDPARRLAALKEMAASGPPMLNGIVSKIAADGVITDEEMAQAEGMFSSYRAAPAAGQPEWRAAGSNIFNTGSGEFRSPTGTAAQGYEFTGSAKNIAEAHRALADPNAPPEIQAAARAVIAEANRSGQGGGGDRRATEWETKLAILRNPSAYSEAEQAWAAGSSETTIIDPTTGQVTIERGMGTGDRVRDRQVRSKLDQYARLEGQMDNYERALFGNLPPTAAGITGEVRRAVTGLARQANGIPGAEQLTNILRRAGVSPTSRDNAKISEVRMRAQFLSRQLVPLFQDDTRLSDADARAAEGWLNLLNTTGNLEDARMAYTILRDILRTQKSYYEGVMNPRPAAAPEDRGMRPVVPPPAPASGNRARDTLDMLRRNRPGG
jgi:hypothetical protein